MNEEQPGAIKISPDPTPPPPPENDLPPVFQSITTPPSHSPPPPPATPVATPQSATPLAPQPVVQVLSPRGVEYVFLTIALITGAIGLIAGLISIFNGQFGFNTLAFPVSVLLVAGPIFAWLFLRLKAAELADPSLQLDASKRRSTQTIQVLSFLTCFFTLIALVATILAKIGGEYDGSIFKVFLNVLAILVVAGGVLFYYWRDEHRG